MRTKTYGAYTVYSHLYTDGYNGPAIDHKHRGLAAHNRKLIIKVLQTFYCFSLLSVFGQKCETLRKNNYISYSLFKFCL